MRHGSREERINLSYLDVFRFVRQRLKLMSITMNRSVTPQSSKQTYSFVLSVFARDCMIVSDFVREAGIQCLNMSSYAH